MAQAGVDGFEQLWVNDIGSPKPSDEHYYVEIYEENSAVTYSQSERSSEELLTLVESPARSRASWSLRLLISPANDEADWWRPLYPLEVIEGLTRHWHIPSHCFCFGNDHDRSISFSPLPGDTSWIGFQMSDRSVGSFAISYHFGTRTTYTLCHRLQNRYKGRFLRRVKACAASGFHPYLLPLILARLSTEQFDEHISEMRADFLSIQKTMGTNVYFLPEDVDESPDLTEMPRKLTAIANAVAVTAGKTQQIIRGIDYLGVQLRGFEHRHGDGKEDKVVAQMKDELAMTQSRLAASAYISDWLAQSVQAHVQMVYALLAQRDNQLNHRYGADMRIIAAVTLLFLPGTFVATLLSASFWDFGPDNHGAVVSKWVWLYCLLTVALTATVLGVWRGYPVIRKFRRGKREADVESGKKEV